MALRGPPLLVTLPLGHTGASRSPLGIVVVPLRDVFFPRLRSGSDWLRCASWQIRRSLIGTGLELAEALLERGHRAFAAGGARLHRLVANPEDGA
jgi:hypothetical protein